MDSEPTLANNLTITIKENNQPPGEEQPRLDPALADARSDRISELIDEIKLSAKLAKDHASRGDKTSLLSRTLRGAALTRSRFSRALSRVPQGDDFRSPPVPSPTTRPTGRRSSSAGRSRCIAGWSSPARRAGSWRPDTSAPAASIRWASTSCCPSSKRPTRW